MKYFIALLLVLVSLNFASGEVFRWDTYTSTADGFKMYCGTSANVPSTVVNLRATITPSTITTYTQTGFNVGTTYYCNLTAFLGTLQSVPSNEISFTPALVPPTGFSVEQIVGIMKTITGGSR